MSIDHYLWVPVGSRSDKNLKYSKYDRYSDLKTNHKDSPHQVFLAHGGPNVVDQQYFFEDAADAQWFWDEGYKERLYLIGAGPEDYGYDRMALWIDGKETAGRGYDGPAPETMKKLKLAPLLPPPPPMTEE